jgi:hypothetical protein
MSGNVPIPTEQDPYKIVRAVRELFEGRSNAVGRFTLAANAASTTVTAANCGAASTVLLTPTSAHAAAEVGSGTIYVSAVANGSFTLTHANNSQADRTFLYAALG